jgi:geranylgeranyl diphosphate synthase, type II
MNLPRCYVNIQNYVENSLLSIINEFDSETRLKQAMIYTLTAGGKRLRPTLLMGIYMGLTNRLSMCTSPTKSDMDSFNPNPIWAGAALEYVHTYSLIHDDLPAMDNDDFRRGKPTLHKVSGQALAILAGDALLSSSFQLIHKGYSCDPQLAMELSNILSASSLAMVEGQVIDTINPENQEKSLESLYHLVDLKTGALITAALTMGATIAKANKDTINTLENIGLHMGRLFQITDDILDETGTIQNIGKTPGKDQLQGKFTFTSFLGIEKAKELAQHQAISIKDLLIKIDMDPLFLDTLVDFILNRNH